MDNMEQQQVQEKAPAPEMDTAKAEGQVKSGANWFFWIAGLSLVNSLLNLFKVELQFVVGLGATQLIDAFAQIIGGNIVMIVGILLSMVIAGCIGALGWQAGKKKAWAFILGMVVYGLDAFLVLWFQDYVSFAFHVFALIMIGLGLKALLDLNKSLKKAATS
jgi:hypothetical protein